MSRSAGVPIPADRPVPSTDLALSTVPGQSTRSRRVQAAIACAVAALVITSCSGDDTADTADADSAGAALYMESCASCHGNDLRGTAQGPPHLSQVYAPDHHPDASFRAAIANGSRAHHWDFGDMPPVEGLDDDEVDLIIAYVREQQRAHGLDPYPPG